jgi:hypothetical protein
MSTRREFIALLGAGGGVAACGAGAAAKLGFLRSSSLAGAEHLWRRSARV